MTRRQAQFHRFESTIWAVSEVSNLLPGDMLVCPGTIAWHIKDFSRRGDKNVTYLRLKHSPLLVIGVVDGDKGDSEWPTEPGHEKYVTVIVLSRHGVLLIIQPKSFSGT